MYYIIIIKVLLVLYQRMSNSKQQQEGRTRICDICECEVHFLCHVPGTFFYLIYVRYTCTCTIRTYVCV
jgi:hypothetical protein